MGRKGNLKSPLDFTSALRGLCFVLFLLTFCIGSAGYYVVTYDLSDCTVSITGPSSGWQHGYGVSDGTASGGDFSHDYAEPPLETMASYGSVVCEGEIVVTFTWQPSFAGEEPPQVVVVKKVASAVWSGKTGAADNGLEDEPAVYIDGGSCSGTRYEVVENPGFTFERTISPAASGSLPSTGWFGLECASAGVSVTFSAIPVTIESNFALRLGNDFAFLIGQQADFYISGPGLTFDQHSWTPGHTAIGGVQFGNQVTNSRQEFGVLYPSGLWSYYESRVTLPVSSLADDNPSWFYEGAQNLKAAVSSTFRVRVGAQDLGSVSIRRRVAVFVPRVDHLSSAGVASILDENRTTTNDAERARAGRKNVETGFHISAWLTMPPEFDAGNGKWGFVQLVRREIWNGTSTAYDPKGLDNVYPYPGYWKALDDAYEVEYFIDWKPVGGTSNLLMFNDSPSISIYGLQAYVDEFDAWCFVVLRPPVQEGQNRVDLPVFLHEWSYDSESLRIVQQSFQMWMLTELYDDLGSTWQTLPSCIGVQPGETHYDLPSSALDWDSVVVNG